MGAPLEVTWREGVGKGRLGESYGGTLRIRKEYRLWSCNPTSHTLACLYFSSGLDPRAAWTPRGKPLDHNILDIFER